MVKNQRKRKEVNKLAYLTERGIIYGKTKSRNTRRTI